MKREIDIENWNRKEHFEFFTSYDDPFYGVVTEIDCSIAKKYAKINGFSFFAFYLYKSLKAANSVEEFRYRIEDGKVFCYDKIHAGSTIGRQDGTFGFSFVAYQEEFSVFLEDLKKEIDAVANSTGIRFNEEAKRMDAIHYSTLPWNKFTGLTHAKNFKFKSSNPKITFGKIFEREGKWFLPISVDVHHGLVDGLHISRFLEKFQELMNQENI
ncbi:chloramphenicol acetyltransferase [Aureivirga marina]|uniref:chloramphenicol acetyltransferase n=1 Tax=Aureivirga marina TaxID=1182451 RepID=UPI0018CA78EA|nr:chloramphenicol acetyltransferase [Aureivirga marina]